MKIVLVAVLCLLCRVGVLCTPLPLPSDPSLAKAVKSSLDFIHHEQQVQVADNLAQAHPTFVESNDTQPVGQQQQQQQLPGSPGSPGSPKKDWELVPKTQTPLPTAPPPPPHHRGAGAGGTTPALTPYFHSRTTEAPSRFPKGGRAYGHQATVGPDFYRSRRQAGGQQAPGTSQADPADQALRRDADGDLVPDRSELVIGSNAIRVSNKVDAGARRTLRTRPGRSE